MSTHGVLLYNVHWWIFIRLDGHQVVKIFPYESYVHLMTYMRRPAVDRNTASPSTCTSDNAGTRFGVGRWRHLVADCESHQWCHLFVHHLYVLFVYHFDQFCFQLLCHHADWKQHTKEWRSLGWVRDGGRTTEGGGKEYRMREGTGDEWGVRCEDSGETGWGKGIIGCGREWKMREG